ncbi:SPOSA6832_04839, partial [Sporobolomyces salmonicolor]
MAPSPTRPRAVALPQDEVAYQQRDADNGAELDALELSDPQKTCRHLFLQSLIARRCMTFELARKVYKDCTRLCGGALLLQQGRGGRSELTYPPLLAPPPPLAVENSDPLETFIAQMEPGLSMCGLDIKQTRDQETGTPLFVLINSIQDDPAKLATEYKAEEIAFFKAVVEKIILAPRMSYSVSQTDAVRCAKAPVTKTVAIQLIKSLLAKGWLTLHPSGRLILSPRSLVELAPYLRDTFQDEDEEDTTPRERPVVDCNLCLGIVTSVSRSSRLTSSTRPIDLTLALHSPQGYACPNEDCGVRLHSFCVSQRLGNSGQCPDRLTHPGGCNQIWPQDPTTRKFVGVPIGVSALGLGNDVDGHPTSQASDDDEEETPRPSKKRRTSGAVLAKKGNGKKRTQDEGEDEDDEETEDDQSTSVSPAATRRSGRSTANPRRVANGVDDSDDDGTS